MQALVGVFLHALDDFFGKVTAVISGHTYQEAFHHLPLGRVVYVLGGVFVAHAALFQLSSVEIVVTFVSSVPVYFMKNYDVMYENVDASHWVTKR